MNQTLIINEKNNKYYIEKSFYNHIENIIFFDSKKGAKILELGRSKTFKASHYNNLYHTKQIYDSEADKIILNHAPVRKLKEDLHFKNNFYLSKQDKYMREASEITLYININSENIEITEGEEIREEIEEGYYYIYKKYLFKNLFITCNDLQHIYFKDEDLEGMNYSDFRRYDIKKIDDELNKERKFSLKPFTNYLNRLKELKKEGYTHIGYKRIFEDVEALEIKIFIKTLKTEEKIQRDKNIEYLKNIIHDRKKIKSLFNKFNINIDLVKFEDGE